MLRGKGRGVGGFAFTYYPGQARGLVVNWGGGGGVPYSLNLELLLYIIRPELLNPADNQPRIQDLARGGGGGGGRIYRRGGTRFFPPVYILAKPFNGRYANLIIRSTNILFNTPRVKWMIKINLGV